jgi:hypothetical protein
LDIIVIIVVVVVVVVVVVIIIIIIIIIINVPKQEDYQGYIHGPRVYTDTRTETQIHVT